MRMNYGILIVRIILLLSFFTLPKTAAARPAGAGQFGLGIVIGDPNAGIAMKYWRTPTTAIDGAVSWSSFGSIGLHADYLVHVPNLIKVEQGLMPIYYGIGGFVRTHHYSNAGVRLPVGIAYLLPQHPLEFFLELSGHLGLVPDTLFSLGIGLGGRYYF
jgi:hypothetical protein